MDIRTVRCEACGETRVGRLVDGETRPFSGTCANCGSSEYRDALQ